MLPPVDTTILSTCPKFDALYNDICNNKLNPDGTSKLDAKAQRERDGLSQELRKARIEATKKDLVYSGLHDLSYRADHLPEELQELVAIVATLLEGQILEEDRDLLQDVIKRFKENINPITAGLSRLFLQDVTAVATLADPDSPMEYQGLTPYLENLTGSIATSRLKIAESRIKLAQETSMLHASYCKIIEASIRILEQTIHGSAARGTKAKADYLAVVAEGMTKKLSVQHGQFVSQVYSPEFQEALRTKQHNLDDESRRVARKLRDAEAKLEEYRRGSGIKQMAQEYADIVRETEKVKADVARLQGEKK